MADCHQDGMFDNLPIELIHNIFSFFDIGSLGKMAQMNICGILSDCALSNFVWADLVHRRFGIDSRKSHPRTHGGTTWKNAYRTMSYCNRIPKSRFTSTRNAVFAKGGGGKRGDHVSSWVLLSHTSNCQTRRHHRPTSRGTQLDSNIIYDNVDRFVELKVCLQNAKSNRGPIVLDVMRSTLDLLGNCAPQSLCGWPRIIFKSGQNNAILNDQHILDVGIELKPFDFCIIAMTFACGSDIFETDVLSRALELKIPLLRSNETITATFLPESDVWKYYVELPGGFLSLHDRTSLINP